MVIILVLHAHLAIGGRVTGQAEDVIQAIVDVLIGIPALASIHHREGGEAIGAVSLPRHDIVAAVGKIGWIVGATHVLDLLHLADGGISLSRFSRLP